ncbi:transposase, partial [mine drainage metagenome]
IMIKLLAETPGDQDMIDKILRAFDQLRKRLEDKNREHEEYKKRHPATVGIKNGKSYEIRDGAAHENTPSISQDDPASMPWRRSPGAQDGHKGHFRKTPKITERITIHAKGYTCPICYSCLVRRGIRHRTVEDIPEIMPDVIEYRIERMYCKHCRIMVEPDVTEALPSSRLSIRAMLIIAYFRTGMRMSVENVSRMMKEVFGIHVSEGEIQNILSQLSNALGDEYTRLLDSIRESSYRHMDSTSWRIDGDNYNLWTFVTRCEAIFVISKSNGHEVPLEILGKHNGTDIHDRHRAFDTLAGKTGNDQQPCWSHIICDAKELEQFYGEDGGRIKRAIQEIHEEGKLFMGKGTPEDVDKLYHKLVFLLTADYESVKCRNFVKNLLKIRKEWLLKFVTDPDVESTNNRAERALRPSVICRKVSGGSRSGDGAKTYETITSILYTAKLRKQNFIRDVPGMLAKRKRIPYLYRKRKSSRDADPG